MTLAPSSKVTLRNFSANAQSAPAMLSEPLIHVMNIKNRLARWVLALLAIFGLGAETVQAAAADAASVVTTATTAFEAVSVLVVAMVGFFIIVRIVKGIRK